MKRYPLRDTLLVASLVLASVLLIAACGGPENTTDTATAADSPAASGEIVISGMVDYPMTFVTLDTDYMDWVTVSAEDAAAGSTEYDGVRLSEIFSYVGVQPDATTVKVTGREGTSTELSLTEVSEDALLTVTDDNAFELIVPGADSEAWIKDVITMEFN